MAIDDTGVATPLAPDWPAGPAATGLAVAADGTLYALRADNSVWAIAPGGAARRVLDPALLKLPAGAGPMAAGSVQPPALGAGTPGQPTLAAGPGQPAPAALDPARAAPAGAGPGMPPGPGWTSPATACSRCLTAAWPSTG